MKLVTGVIIELMQGQIEVFAEWIQGWHLYILRYSASVFGNSVSVLIVMLVLSGHSNRYRVTIAMTCNSTGFQIYLLEFIEDIKATSSALVNEVNPNTLYNISTLNAKLKKKSIKKVKAEKFKIEKIKTEDEDFAIEIPVKSGFTVCIFIV